MNIHKPLFSIGVTTYNRKELLKQTLLSLLEQTFSDFEVIVGNDFPDENISAETFGIKDSRIRFINHKRNIGELENMNYLLNTAQGRYFTWQFDDDPCAPDFLQEVYSALNKFNFPACVFTSYLLIYGTSAHKFKKNGHRRIKLFSGKDFLKTYLSGKLKAMGCCGFHDTDYLKKIGGVQRLTDGPMALYTEHLILIRDSLLPEVVYIDAPLVSSRVHENSWTCSNLDVELFKQGGINLLRESIRILSRKELKDDFQQNFPPLLRIVLSSVVIKNIMCNKQFNMNELKGYIASIREEFDPLKGFTFYEMAMSALDAAVKEIPRYIFKAKIKMIMPLRCLKFAHMARLIFSRYTYNTKPFD